MKRSSIVDEIKYKKKIWEREENNRAFSISSFLNILFLNILVNEYIYTMHNV